MGNSDGTTGGTVDSDGGADKARNVTSHSRSDVRPGANFVQTLEVSSDPTARPELDGALDVLLAVKA